MKQDFPPDERPPFFAVKRNLEKKVYDGLFLIEESSGKIMGYAIVTAPGNNKYVLLTFFAVLPEFRDKGIGGSFLKMVCARYTERVTVLEVEDPLSIKTAEARLNAERRIKFYERCGFIIHDTQKAKIFGVDMLIMADTKEDLGSVREVMHSLYLPAFTSGKWLKFIDVVD